MSQAQEPCADHALAVKTSPLPAAPPLIDNADVNQTWRTRTFPLLMFGTNKWSAVHQIASLGETRTASTTGLVRQHVLWLRAGLSFDKKYPFRESSANYALTSVDMLFIKKKLFVSVWMSCSCCETHVI